MAGKMVTSPWHVRSTVGLRQGESEHGLRGRRGALPEEPHVGQDLISKSVSVSDISPPLQWMIVWARILLAGHLRKCEVRAGTILEICAGQHGAVAHSMRHVGSIVDKVDMSRTSKFVNYMDNCDAGGVPLPGMKVSVALMWVPCSSCWAIAGTCLQQELHDDAAVCRRSNPLATNAACMADSA